jgi:hypothetical protein
LQEEKNLRPTTFNGFILQGAKDLSTWFCQDLILKKVVGFFTIIFRNCESKQAYRAPSI